MLSNIGKCLQVGSWVGTGVSGQWHCVLPHIRIELFVDVGQEHRNFRKAVKASNF